MLVVRQLSRPISISLTLLAAVAVHPAFTLLHRVVNEHVPPADAYTALKAVWVPRDQWAEFVKMVLEKNNVEFDLPAAN